MQFMLYSAKPSQAKPIIFFFIEFSVHFYEGLKSFWNLSIWRHLHVMLLITTTAIVYHILWIGSFWHCISSHHYAPVNTHTIIFIVYLFIYFIYSFQTILSIINHFTALIWRRWKMYKWAIRWYFAQKLLYELQCALIYNILWWQSPNFRL